MHASYPKSKRVKLSTSYPHSYPRTDCSLPNVTQRAVLPDHQVTHDFPSHPVTATLPVHHLQFSESSHNYHLPSHSPSLSWTTWTPLVTYGVTVPQQAATIPSVTHPPCHGLTWTPPVTYGVTVPRKAATPPPVIQGLPSLSSIHSSPSGCTGKCAMLAYCYKH